MATRGRPNTLSFPAPQAAATATWAGEMRVPGGTITAPALASAPMGTMFSPGCTLRPGARRSVSRSRSTCSTITTQSAPAGTGAPVIISTAFPALTYAKRLFAVPIAILGQAVGQASLPFFSRLFGEKKFAEFAATVNGSVYRITAASLLITGWMMAIALPLIDLVYRRGRFTFADSESTALYFFVFSLSLALWSSQALYAR